ncbi:tRNA(Glu)-specific nuclease WapA precursor [compost metagenome]
MKKSFIQKVLLILLSISIFIPNYRSSATDVQGKTQITTTNPVNITSLDETSEVNVPEFSLENTKTVVNSVYDTNTILEIERIKARTFQKKMLKQGQLTLGLKSTVRDLTKEEVDELILSGAGKEDIYWVNLLTKETTLTPEEIFEVKKNGEISWEETEKRILKEITKPSSVEEAVYNETVTEFLTVSDAVYMENKQKINSLSSMTSSFDALVNSALDALVTQQQINQTNKQQYADRNSSSEMIDPASGSLTWKENEISLPGRDGLDLNIGIMYNSNQSFAYMRNSSSSGQIQKYNYYISRYDLGMGWSFQFPSVQSANGYLFYHNGQGAVYRIDFNASDTLGSYTHLVGYQGKDVQFKTDSGTFNNGQASSAYYLLYDSQKREYFAQDGRLLGIMDRYGNTIKFEHIDRVTYDGATNKVISSITDSLGRVVMFNYDTNLNTTGPFLGENITVSVNVNGSETEKVVFTKGRTSLNFNGKSDGYGPILNILNKGNNQANELTYLRYDSIVGKFNYDQKTLDSYAGYNDYHLLNYIQYPYSSASYKYDLVTRNLGVTGAGQESRITFRNDSNYRLDGYSTKTYNKLKYSYTGDYTGDSIHSNPENLPESYRYSSTSTIESTSASNNLTATYNFNGLQQMISTVKQAANGERKEARNTAFHSIFKYLPTQTMYADYGIGDSDSNANILYAEFGYTDWGALMSETKPLTISQLNDIATKSKYSTTYTYEPSFHELQSKSWYQNGTTPLNESYTYNEYGRIKSYVNPKYEIINYSYEPVTGDAKKISKIIVEKPMQNGMISRSTITYGSQYNFGYATEQIDDFTNISPTGQQTVSRIRKQIAYDMGSGRILEVTDSNEKKTIYTYDELGRVKTISYPSVTNLNGEQYEVQDQFNYYRIYGEDARFFDGKNEDEEYLQVNFKQKYTQKSNGAITYLSEKDTFYDGFGILRLEIYNNYASTQYHIDDLSRVVDVTDPMGNSTKVMYDAWGQQKEAVDAYGNLYVSEHNLKLRKTTNYLVAASDIAAYRYDPSVAALKTNYLEQNYDQWGHLLLNATYKDWPVQSQSNLVTELYSYDISGNVIGYTDLNKNLNSDGVTTKYTYDALNRLISVKDALGQTTSYQYDRSGQITDTTMQNSQTGVSTQLKSKTYNELGLLINKKDVALQNENQLYNQLGLITQKTDRNRTVSNYQYDESNQVVSTLLTGTGGDSLKNNSIFGSNGIKIDTFELYLNGTKTASQTTTIDNLKRTTAILSQATGYATSTGYVYDNANRTTRMTGTHSGIGSFYINYQYSMQRLNKVQTNGESGLNSAVSANVSYEYFPTGQVKSITYPTLGDGTTLMTEYTYDALNRISTVQNKKGSIVLSSYTYLYDNNGNRTSVTEVLNNGSRKTTTYEYDKLNRLCTITRPNGGGTTSYMYDLQGNRQIVSDTAANQSEFSNISYTYDLKNTLIGVTKDNGSTTIDYLPNGLRYQKTTANVKTQYNYNGNGEVISESKSNGQKANYIRGDRLLVKKDITTAKDYYYLYNGQGDVVQIVDTNGTVVNSYSYDVWGNIANQTEGISNSFKYAGEIYDQETGLYYLRARYYDPSIGRFINEDTVEGQIDNPLSLNLYTYVHNNPLRYTDFSGHIPTPIEAAVMAGNIYDATSNDYGNKLSGGWALENILTNDEGLKIGVYLRVKEDGTTEYSLVNKGTSTKGDWGNNFQQPFGFSDDMEDSISESTNFVKTHKDNEITMVGHSKGGAEAAANAVATNRNAILFNPASVVLKSYGLSSSTYKANMTTYIVKGEILSVLEGSFSKPIGKVVNLPTQYSVSSKWNIKRNIQNSIKNHSMDSVKSALKKAGFN